MVSTAQLSLASFLKLPQIDASPAWEFAGGKMWQKPTPKTRHSLLQKRLLYAVDNSGDNYTALPELRCTFGGRSIVPDVAVIAWDRIPLNSAGEPADDFEQAPDWIIEILSPNQSPSRVIDNILHALKDDCRLGWLLDPDDASIIAFWSGQEPRTYRDEQPLPVLAELSLELTAAQVFSWLQVGR